MTTQTTTRTQLHAIAKLLGVGYRKIQDATIKTFWKVYLVIVPGRRPTFVSKAAAEIKVVEIEQERRRQDAKLIWVNISGPKFSQALKVCRQSGATYNPATKLWQIRWGAYCPSMMSEVTPPVAYEPEDCDWETNPRYGYAEA